MANKITPNILRIIFIPFFPIKCSIRADVFSTTKITITLQTTAIIIFSSLNSARKDNRVVKLPGPAMSGKANGKIEAVFGESLLSLYKVIPKIISIAIKKITNAPATANEFTSMPISFKILSPKRGIVS